MASKKKRPHHPTSNSTGTKSNKAVTPRQPQQRNRPQKSAKAQQKMWLWIGGAISIVLIAILIGVLHQQGETKNSTNSTTSSSKYASEITDKQASELIDQGAFLLDVREQSEWNEYHVEKATLIPLGELPQRLSEVPHDKVVITMCRTGVRSAKGRDTLLSSGYTQVTSVKGGITQWRADGYPTVSGS